MKTDARVRYTRMIIQQTFLDLLKKKTISKITASSKHKQLEYETKYSVTSSLILTTGLSLFLSLLLIISKPILTLIIGDAIGYEIIVTLIPSIIFTRIVTPCSSLMNFSSFH